MIDAETQAEIDTVEPVPQPPARVPQAPYDWRENLRLSPSIAWRWDHPPTPWQTATHRGEIYFTPEGRYETTGLPLDDRSKRSPVHGCYHAESLEELREIIARECGPEEITVKPVARPPREVKLPGQGAHNTHHRVQHIYNSQCRCCQREPTRWKRACQKHMRELLTGSLKYFQRDRYARDLAILEAELEPPVETTAEVFDDMRTR